MARLQILELPEGANDERAPFVLVIDEATTDPEGQLVLASSDFEGTCQRIGARAVLVFEETIEIPANDTSAYLSSEGGDGTTVGSVHVRVEPDFEQFHERVQDEIRKAQGELVRALNRDA
ncbi:hypothetical protein ACFYNA_15240 [Streptomyces sp. NPDC006640]|uniref:hypothetical protein n=1 Tax=Streptomyces sp. NPDC006640 TaxID=3364754 RepID=UPI0036A016D3